MITKHDWAKFERCLDAIAANPRFNRRERARALRLALRHRFYYLTKAERRTLCREWLAQSAVNQALKKLGIE